MRILIRTPNWLGDSVMTIPTVNGVKRLFPDAEVWVWTKPGLMALWRLLLSVDNVIDSVPKNHSFDLGILLTNSFGSALRMYFAGIPERMGYNINGRRFLLTQPVSLKKGLHQVDYFLGVIDKVSVDSIPKIDIPLELKEEARRFLTSHGWDGDPNIIGIHATASYGSAKCWPKERFSELIDSLDSWVLVVGSEEQKRHYRDKVINLAGETDIRMLSGVISLCRVFVANDSGPMHLAASIGVPVVAIFGSTDPSRTGPRGRCIVVRKNVPCSPCFKRRCPKDLECMKAIEVRDVLDAMRMAEAGPDPDPGHPTHALAWVPRSMGRVPRCIVSGHVLGRASDIRIAVVMKDYDEQRGGAERYLSGLLQHIGSVDLIVNRVKGTPPSGINIKTVKAIRWSSILGPLSFNWSVQRFLKRNRYDIVYGLTQIYPQDVYRVGGGLEHSWFDIKYKKMWQRLINYLRPRNIVRLYIENRIFSKGNYKKIIANSNLCKYQILHHYRVSPEDIIVVYNGVDRDRFNPGVKALYRDRVRRELGIGADDKVVLFISNNWKRKGLRELIKAIRPDEWLIVVGRGNERIYRRLAKGNRIRFIGHTTEPERYYGAGSVFVLPTYYDPFANVCIEALSCGLPVVTTRANGAAEFIVNGENGYIINDPGDIADYIEKAFSLQGGVRGLTMEKNVKEILNVFKDVNIRGDASDILINNGYKDFLEKQGWLDFDSVMGEGRGEVYKKNNLRSVVKIDRVFLKRHYKRARPSWAFREWQNIFRLRSIGIPTMEPIAVGEKRGRSFIITESLGHAQRLEDFIKSVRLGIREKIALIHELASLTKQMHRGNLFHKDFYSGHIFVEKNGDRFKLYLIDLQRLCRHWLFKTRWCIKDMASLNFSLSAGFINPVRDEVSNRVNNTDRLRFLKYYLGEDYRGFIKKILAKTDRIARHTEKMLARRKDL